jgi:hypothetical protein
MSIPLIVGIMLVRNEDLFVEQALRNVLHFCDKIIVLDNHSRDHTYAILEHLAGSFPAIELSRIASAASSHEPLEVYAGTPCWVLGVDGDELYDPHGLSVLRQDLQAGVYDDWWVLFGNVLNCVEIDRHSMSARGYLAPPCRSMTKLYNFGLLKSWTNCPQRLHGGDLVFARGHRSLRNDLYKRISWEDSNLRCLHTCFMRRSSRDPEVFGRGLTRQNVTEEQHTGLTRRLWRNMIGLAGCQLGSRWKAEKYRRGPLVEKKVSGFLDSPSLV